MRPRFGGQPLIDAYGDFGFRLGEQRFEGSIIVTPHGLYPLPAAEIGEVTPGSLQSVAECAGEIDFLLIGCGRSFGRLPPASADFLRSLRITPDQMDTGAACRTYNVLRAEDRRVAALLIAVA
ncbi:MAG: Mth938-like domain-containing protein [Parvibaculum sp.]|uniref:Mth938-like domain-containing protein n=1 Tax=Parvibaculum sp. TaxID=2024848 RepID=UPI003C781234